MLAHLRVAGRVSAAFAAAGVPWALLKGAAFLDTLYPDLGSRRLSDVDVLVPVSVAPELDDILLGYGFTDYPAPATHPRSWSSRYNKKYQSNEGTLLEVHTALAPRGLFDVDYDAMLSRLVTYETPQRAVCTLSPEDTLLALAIHEAKHAYAVPAHCHEDVRRVIARWCPDWNLVLEGASAAGARTAIYITLLGAGRAQVPEAMLEALAPSGIHRRLVEGLVSLPEGRPRLPVNRSIAQAATMLAAVDGWGQRTSFVGHYLYRRLPDLRERALTRLRR